MRTCTAFSCRRPARHFDRREQDHEKRCGRDPENDRILPRKQARYCPFPQGLGHGEDHRRAGGAGRAHAEVLELAAVVHDIACPLCREKYGDTNGKHQELESPPLVEAFFADLPVSRADVDRISWLAAHHHTDTNVDGPDHRILLEADFLVNADEGACTRPSHRDHARARLPDPFRDPPARYDLFGITDAAPARLPRPGAAARSASFSSNFAQIGRFPS